jgi:hypothetical protein
MTELRGASNAKAKRDLGWRPHPSWRQGFAAAMTDRERLLDELRPVAFAIAYRMLAQQRLIGVVALGIAGGQIKSVSAIVNPDKLTHLGPVDDLTSLLESAR